MRGETDGLVKQKQTGSYELDCVCGPLCAATTGDASELRRHSLSESQSGVDVTDLH